MLIGFSINENRMLSHHRSSAVTTSPSSIMDEGENTTVGLIFQAFHRFRPVVSI
jgi:hypothetical protein